MTALASQHAPFAATRRPAAGSAGPSAADLAEIESVLAALQVEYDHLARIARDHRQSLSTADRLGVERCAQAQERVVGRLLPLESRRAAWAARVSKPLGLPATAPLSAILAWTGEPDRGRVLATAARLREVGEAVQEQNRVIRAASEALLAHVKGVMSQVARTLSHTGVYARPNTQTSEQVVSSLDLRS